MNFSRKKMPVGSRVLVIEDDPSYGNILKFILERLGCEPILTSRGEEGLAIINKNDPAIDYLIFDCTLPDIDAADFVRRLKKAAPSFIEGGRALPLSCADPASPLGQAIIEEVGRFEVKPIGIIETEQVIKDFVQTKKPELRRQV